MSCMLLQKDISEEKSMKDFKDNLFGDTGDDYLKGKTNKEIKNDLSELTQSPLMERILEHHRVCRMCRDLAILVSQIQTEHITLLDKIRELESK